MSGWTSFIAGFPGAIAAAAIGFAAYLEGILPDSNVFLDYNAVLPATLTTLPFRETVAVFLVIVITFFHVLKINIGRKVQLLLTVLSIVTIILLITVGFIPDYSNSVTINPSVWLHTSHLWLIALIPVMFTYSGWNAAVYVAEEIVNPEKYMFRAMLTGTSVVVVLYLLLNFVYLRNLTLTELAGNIDVVNLMSERLMGLNGKMMVITVVLAALLSGISAMIIAGPRVYFAMARDGVFFEQLSRVNPRFKTPSFAILAQSGWCILLIMTGTFEELLTYTGFAIVLFSTLSVCALLVMEKNNLLDHIFKNSLYFLFVFGGFTMTLNAIVRSPAPSVAGLLMIMAGIPVFYGFKFTLSGRFHNENE